MKFRAMDASHVALLDLFIPSSDFEKFDCSKEDKFAFHTEDLAKIVKRAEAKDPIEFSRFNDESLKIKIGNKRDFELHLLDQPHETETPMPKLIFTANISIAYAIWDKMLKDVGVISNHVTFDADMAAKTLVAHGKGDTGRVSVSFEKNDVDGLQELDLKDNAKSTYSLEYLQKITAALSSVDIIKLEYSSKLPLRLEFPLGEKKGGRIHYFLAPRVQE